MRHLTVGQGGFELFDSRHRDLATAAEVDRLQPRATVPDRRHALVRHLGATAKVDDLELRTALAQPRHRTVSHLAAVEVDRLESRATVPDRLGKGCPKLETVRLSACAEMAGEGAAAIGALLLLPPAALAQPLPNRVRDIMDSSIGNLDPLSNKPYILN